MNEHGDEREELIEQHRDLLERRELDPVTLQVIGGKLDTIAQEMGYTMLRSSYLSIIREWEDLGPALFDHEGREIAESDYTPMHVGSLAGLLEGMYEVFE
jgi:N-methylhydantoinase B